ncbi:hypothetical protein [Yersinia intermedia]|uniref:hypothetical protein n=1 Tax=Yersinia intermedia TaxID=631 RepID=UPI0005ACDC08|nr:hypothetical protein [Yersinia intermedia]AJJ21162.1 hypothetical protein CH53_4193 [Yersinia intermedia]
MKELDSFTVEQLNDFIKSDHAQCGDVAALAAIALAAKRAEPFAWKWRGAVGDIWTQEKRKADFVKENCPELPVTELYTTPQLNSPEIPEGWTSSDPANAALVMLDRIDTIDSADDDRIEDIKLIIRQLAAAPESE